MEPCSECGNNDFVYYEDNEQYTSICAVCGSSVIDVDTTNLKHQRDPIPTEKKNQQIHD